MSNPRYPWWGYARKIIYLYPERCRQHQEMLRQNITPGYCEQVGGHTASRTVEQITVKAMTAPEYREYKAVYDAIAVKGNPELMRLLTLLYWQKHKRYTIYGAAQECHISERTARRWSVDFTRQVGRNMNFLE